MKVSNSDSNYLQLACDSLIDLVNVEGIAILIEKKIDDLNKLVLMAGAGLIAIEREMLDIAFERLKEELSCFKEGLLDSEVDSAFKYSWPSRVRNIIAVPLSCQDKVIGMMLATNRIGKKDFDSIDMKLFNSVANECAVFIENENLFTDLKQLFMGSLKALTKSIDAKDKYTHGHSERVAYISKWLAEKGEKMNESYQPFLSQHSGGLIEKIVEGDQFFKRVLDNHPVGLDILPEIELAGQLPHADLLFRHLIGAQILGKRFQPV